MNHLILDEQLKQFLNEDIGHGDLSSQCIPEDAKGRGQLSSKAQGVFYGCEVIRSIYRLYAPMTDIEFYIKDGEKIKQGDIICRIEGCYRHLLETERVLLNLIQHLSGVATTTAEAVVRLDDHSVKIVDTRKTTPGLRMLEKLAVKAGGGHNHRYHLADAVMLKDNHLAFFSSIKKAVATIRSHISHMTKIEVEIETYEQLIEAIESNVDVIMFDNLPPQKIKEWLSVVPDSIATEASGNITLESIHTYKHCGIDFISLGALTHSSKALDISLQIEEINK
ncbi:nicotinate-nucleotide pyrophosphorylase [carboxylating] [Pelagirhabdus alkalitolerans]|uniref:Probable nicotinate-nucleotide pyrophosphorylase [carboxylating] n=1 Tax=Pelagirhabdus alkalitolerans TaxID=1612202 RepID=A0A1G6HJ17_9BACI|nr:carboxylating nicotinate-nucleotide diphosphorylase [Pelagirhabdus alkalitolerans]SDB94143.1 nicotinate-nucleotide pyrophosphorylase [carboxylating] [Pelagirhabdus alkalitolerans]